MDMEETVCDCMGVTVGDIKKAIDDGATSVEEVQDATSAGTGCGGCLDKISELVSQFTSEK